MLHIFLLINWYRYFVRGFYRLTTAKTMRLLGLLLSHLAELGGKGKKFLYFKQEGSFIALWNRPLAFSRPVLLVASDSAYCLTVTRLDEQLYAARGGLLPHLLPAPVLAGGLLLVPGSVSDPNLLNPDQAKILNPYYSLSRRHLNPDPSCFLLLSGNNIKLFFNFKIDTLMF